jgi:acetyltransferase-like isoleucine patch superfamily enzyme
VAAWAPAKTGRPAGDIDRVPIYDVPVDALRRTSAGVFLTLYKFLARARAKLFSLASAGSFESFGRRTVLALPVRLAGESRIRIGDDVYVGSGSWLQTLDGYGDEVALEIGDGTNISGTCVLSAARSVRLGRSVLVARGVYISDHIHAYADTTRPVLAQGLARVEPVEIGDGAWLGQNVVVCPGVRIGRGAVVGANSVVLEDVPEYSLAVGAPARVVRSFGVTAEPAA